MEPSHLSSTPPHLDSSTIEELPRRLLTRLEIIGFEYPYYVYDGNRPLAPILRQRWCSLMYDVYGLA
jgi:hypothetical protein